MVSFVQVQAILTEINFYLPILQISMSVHKEYQDVVSSVLILLEAMNVIVSLDTTWHLIIKHV